MNRRNFLQATALAWAGYAAGDHGTATARAGRGIDDGTVPAGKVGATASGADRWFLNWIPPSVVDGSGDAAFGTSPVPPDARAAGPAAAGDRYLHRLADHARLTVAVGVDAAEQRRLLEGRGYERLGARPGYELFGRAGGRRYRSVALPDGGDVAVTGVGPAPGPVVGRVRAAAATDGMQVEPDSVLGELLAYVGPDGHVSVELRPVPAVAGAAETLDVGRKRTRVRTVVIPDGGAAADYLDGLDGEAGVLSVRTGRRGRAVVREVVVRTSALAGWLEGSHVG